MINTASLYDAMAGKVDGIAAPVKGLNTQVALAGLSQDYAIQLDNWVCQPDAIVTRGGSANHATGFASPPKSLMVYSAAGVRKMFAASANGIFDTTSAGAIGAAAATLTNGQGVSVNFATSAGQFLYFVNGVDNAKLYNGTVWADSTATGLALNTIKSVETYRQRIFFLQNTFLGFWYLPADSIAGAAAAFRVGSLCRLGGEVTAHGTWSVDGGSGPDDHYALATSEGEVIVFRGSDPGVVANWTYVGTFNVGKPLGVNCFAKFGGDLLYLCENGCIPLSELLVSTTRNYKRALTNNIEPTIANAAALYKSLAGWKVHVCPRRALVLINAPLTSSTAVQYVYNSYSGGWSTFSRWNAADFVEFNGDTYFTTGNVVAKAFTGYSDMGANITAICDTAYNRFRTRQQLQPSMMRAVFAAGANISYTLGLAQDFSGAYTESVYQGSGGTVGFWDSGLWDTALWGGGFNLKRDWVTIAARGGIALSTRFKVESSIASSVLLAVDYKFAQQGLIS